MILGAVKLDVFPKAPHGEIAWLKLLWVRFHVFCRTAINCRRGRKKLKLVVRGKRRYKHSRLT